MSSGVFTNQTASSASNPYASLSSAQAFANQIMADPSFVNVNAFLSYPDPVNNGYTCNACYDLFDRYIKSAPSASDVSYVTLGYKLLLTLDDGTVIIDTSKTGTVSMSAAKTIAGVTKAKDDSVAQNSSFSYANKQVNENHNSRPEIMNAVLSASGVGSARRYSSSSSSPFTYYAVRLGSSPQANVGTLRIAINEYIANPAGAKGNSANATV